MRIGVVVSIGIAALFLALPAWSGESSQGALEETSFPNLPLIIARMVEQGRFQEQAVRSYRAIRRFEAFNRRFKIGAKLKVLTTFQKPASYDSEVMALEGSKFINARNYKKFLMRRRRPAARKQKPKMTSFLKTTTLSLIQWECAATDNATKLRFSSDVKAGTC
jgi:hypothetical protein